MEARDDEREEITDRALWDFASDLLDAWNIEDTNAPSLIEDFRDRFVGRFIVGARKDPEPEITDEMVERAAHKIFEPDGPGGEYTWAEMVREDPTRADLWRADARAALEAAFRVPVSAEGSGEGEQG